MIEKTRKTKETDITLKLNPQGQQKIEIDTGHKFFDHMLEQLCFHSGFDCHLSAKGDLAVDDHHMVEDVALCLGSALRDYWQAQTRIARYGQVLLPMDDVLVMGALDICGRPFFNLAWQTTRESVGGLALEMVPHFFQSFSIAGSWTLHLRQMSGSNHHHLVEACFKTTGRLLRQALAPSDQAASTKGGLWASQ
ncbi:MAG: imidazoleglycerol-phosphate dehydratase HisB [Acidobacteria bacterium]|nr:imidazoleglycerol-phosphate dehydratase HisB [Acidobacteriota bacterium]MCB9398044.1 imidazoleglycerol-phosphate dehydratase HisB [Acidobacteriota bacterium]